MFNKKKNFPTFAVIVLMAAVLWLLTDLEVITYDIPWLPLIAVIVALGWIINYYQK